MPPDRLELPAENLADPETPRRAGRVESRTVIPYGDDQLAALRPRRHHHLGAGRVPLGIGQRGIQRALQLIEYLLRQLGTAVNIYYGTHAQAGVQSESLAQVRIEVAEVLGAVNDELISSYFAWASAIMTSRISSSDSANRSSLR